MRGARHIFVSATTAAAAARIRTVLTEHTNMLRFITLVLTHFK